MLGLSHMNLIIVEGQEEFNIWRCQFLLEVKSGGEGGRGQQFLVATTGTSGEVMHVEKAALSHPYRMSCQAGGGDW